MVVDPARSVEDFTLDDDEQTVSLPRTLTPLLPALERGEVIEIDLDHSESAARFLECVARLIRVRGKLRISVE